MPRAFLASTCIYLAACSSAEPSRPGVFGGEGASLVASPPAQLPEQSPASTEGELRTRLVRDADPTAAALALVQRLEREERHREALFLLDTLSRRFAVEATADDGGTAAREASSGERVADYGDPRQATLAVARAGLLRDLGRRHEAVAVLERVIAAAGPVDVSPALWFELAELCWLEGDRVGSRAALSQLLERHAEHAWTTAHAVEIADLDRELLTRERPLRIKVRDLLGNLRGCPDAKERLRIFEELCRHGGAGKARAETVLLEDPEPLLRARATAQVTVAPEALAEFCAAGLADPEPLVRVAAAGRAAALPAEEAAALLLPTMAAETEAEAFRSMHAVLRQFRGDTSDISTDAAADPAQRSAVVAEWRKQWER